MARKREDKTVLNFMRHIRQELTLATIHQFCCLPHHGVLLDAIAQIEDHLLDLRLERFHLSACFNRGEPGKVTIHSHCRDLRELSHMRHQTSGHSVHNDTVVVSNE
jgi:hypothetical protein